MGFLAFVRVENFQIYVDLMAICFILLNYGVHGCFFHGLC